MYRDQCFKVESLEQIEKDLKEASTWPRKFDRIFLVNADAFVLSGAKLKAIGQKIAELYPWCKTIATNARITNITNKTDQELRELRNLNFNEFTIGLESASDNVLNIYNKGYSQDEARTQLLRLRKAGISFFLNIIIGGGGIKHSSEHIQDTIDMVNDTNPDLIYTSYMHFYPGTELYEEREKGNFVENTVRMNLKETKDLLSGVNVSTNFFGLHTSNPVPMYGVLPNDKEKLLNQLEEGISQIQDSVLDNIPQTGVEGRLIK
jgi:radical SAM superfamily enzyme YgiQ (UPF0313 family)